MEICNLCAEYGTHCDGNMLDFGDITSCTGYTPKSQNTSPKKKSINPPRDLGKNNSVAREHLDIWKKEDIPNYIKNNPTRVLLQRIINKIEHKFNHCEEFLDNNKDDLSLSYYSEGYYNGRARAFEDTLDFIKDILEKACEEEDNAR